jgi:hypothetical protein
MEIFQPINIPYREKLPPENRAITRIFLDFQVAWHEIDNLDGLFGWGTA